MGFRYWWPQRSNRRTYSDLIGKPPVASGYTTPNLQGDGIGVSIGITRSNNGMERTGKRLQYYLVVLTLLFRACGQQL